MSARKTGSIENLAVVGLDIGKDRFHLVGSIGPANWSRASARFGSRSTDEIADAGIRQAGSAAGAAVPRVAEIAKWVE